jgi:hypothetical protein
MDGARHVVDEEWLFRIDGCDASQVLDRIVGLCRNQVPTRIVDVRVNRRGVAEQVRLPLIGIATDEAVKVGPLLIVVTFVAIPTSSKSIECCRLR